MKYLIIGAVFFLNFVHANSINSATAFATARIVILPSVLTKQVKSMQFDDRGGNEPVTISASDENAAVLQVTGVDEYVYRVQLPERVYLRSSDQQQYNSRIKVHSFSSTNSMESTCPDSLQIGATRDPAPDLDNSSNYQGAFLVTIIY